MFATRIGRSRALERRVELPGALVPPRVEVAVSLLDRRLVEVAQELVHRRHHDGCELNVPRAKQMSAGPIVAKATHQIATAADDSDGQAPAQRLAVRDEVSADAEVLLRAADGQPEAEEHVVDDEDDAALACRPPAGPASHACRRPCRRWPSGRWHQRRVRRGRAVGVHRLDRVDQNAGDVVPRPEHAERRRIHFLQRVDLARRAAGCRRRPARRPTTRGTRRRTGRRASAACDSARDARPASPPRSRTCGTTPRRAPRSPAGAARCRRSGW